MGAQSSSQVNSKEAEQRNTWMRGKHRSQRQTQQTDALDAKTIEKQLVTQIIISFLSFFLSFFLCVSAFSFIYPFFDYYFFFEGGGREGGVKAGLQTMAAIPSESTKKRSSQRLKVMSRIRHRWLKNHRRSSNAGGRRSKVKLWPIFKLGQDLKESHRVAFSWDLSDLSLFILRV